MNFRQLLFLVIAIIAGGTRIQAKAFDRGKKAIFNIFKPKNNQIYIMFQPAGCFCSDDPDARVLGNSYLREAQRAYSNISINEETLFDVAVLVDGKNRFAHDCYFLVPHQVVADLKNGELIPVQVGKKQIHVVVKK